MVPFTKIIAGVALIRRFRIFIVLQFVNSFHFCKLLYTEKKILKYRFENNLTWRGQNLSNDLKENIRLQSHFLQFKLSSHVIKRSSQKAHTQYPNVSKFCWQKFFSSSFRI